jgi:hypothetical protein
MRRIIVPFLLALTGLLSSFALAPAVPGAHAQTAAPAITVTPRTVQVGATATVAGSGFTPNNWAYVYFQRPDGTTNAVFTGTTAGGTFALTLGFTASHGTGTEFLAVYDYATGRWTPFTTIAVTAATPAPVRLLTVAPGTVTPGNTVTASGSGFTPNNWAYVYFQRPDRTAGAFWAQTTGTGTFASAIGFLAAHGCGAEYVWAYDYAAGAWSAPAVLTVTGCASAAAPSNLRVLSVTQLQTAPVQTAVTLQWQANGAAGGFRIHTTLKRLYGGSDSQANDVPAGTTAAQVSFVAGGINPVKTACFTVTALGAAGESASSNQICVNL